MPTFLVRVIQNRDLVGIFFAPNPEYLADLVDECTDPVDCEYMRLPAGGIMWTSPAIPVPIELSRDETDDLIKPDPMPWSRASMSDSWWSSFYALPDEKQRWRPVLQEEPPPPPQKPVARKRAAPAGKVLPFKKRTPR